MSCGSISKEDCQAMDWHVLASQDVQKNKNWMAELNSYKKKCSEHGVPVNESRYIEGVKYHGAIKCTGLKNFHVVGWSGVGEEDALSGDKMRSYYASCSTYRISPAESLYKTGYTNGLTSFCTKKSGYNFGLDGGQYNGTCSKTNEYSFLSGYEQGQSYYKLNRLEDNLRDVKAKHSRILDNIESKRDELVDTKRKRDHYLIEREGYLQGLEENLYEMERSSFKLRPVGSPRTSQDDRTLELRRKLINKRKDFKNKKRDYIEDIADIENEINDLRRSARDTENEINDLTIEINRTKQSITR